MAARKSYDTVYFDGNLVFEWDERKNRKNIRIHDVSFEDAVYVFYDDVRIEHYQGVVKGEERYCIIGCSRIVLFVVYTERNDHIRIISARKATMKERRAYFAD